jgi:hypothetical protein
MLGAGYYSQEMSQQYGEGVDHVSNKPKAIVITENYFNAEPSVNRVSHRDISKFV